MFCPSCGKDNHDTARFCRACGRSLAGLALNDQDETSSPLERIERRLDEIIAHHVGRYFRPTRPSASQAGLAESWKLLGKGYLTVVADLLYAWLMIQFVLEFRLMILLFKSPLLWWRGRRARKSQPPATTSSPALPQPSVTEQISIGSVTEQETEHFTSRITR